MMAQNALVASTVFWMNAPCRLIGCDTGPPRLSRRANCSANAVMDPVVQQSVSP